MYENYDDIELPSYFQEHFDKLKIFNGSDQQIEAIFKIISYVIPNTSGTYYYDISMCYRLGIIIKNCSIQEKSKLLNLGIQYFKSIKKGGFNVFKHNVNTLSKVILISLNGKYNVLNIEPYINNTKQIEENNSHKTYTDDLYYIYHKVHKTHSKPRLYSLYYYCCSALKNEETQLSRVFINKILYNTIDSVEKFQTVLYAFYGEYPDFDQLFSVFKKVLSRVEWDLMDMYYIEILLILFGRSKIIYYHRFDKISIKEFERFVELSTFLLNKEKGCKNDKIDKNDKSNAHNLKHKKILNPQPLFNQRNGVLFFDQQANNLCKNDHSILSHNIGGAGYSIENHMFMNEKTLGISMYSDAFMCFQEVSNKNLKETFNKNHRNFFYSPCHFVNPETMTDYCMNNYRYGMIQTKHNRNEYIDVKDTMFGSYQHLKDILYNYYNKKRTAQDTINILQITKNDDDIHRTLLDEKEDCEDCDVVISGRDSSVFEDDNNEFYTSFIKRCFRRNIVDVKKGKIIVGKIGDDKYYVYCDERVNTGKDVSKHQLMSVFSKSFLDPFLTSPSRKNFIVGNLRNILGHMFLGVKNTLGTEVVINTHLQSGDQFGLKDGISMNELINLITMICGLNYDIFFRNVKTVVIAGDFNLNSDIIAKIITNNVVIHKDFKDYKFYIMFDNMKTHHKYEKKLNDCCDDWETTFNKIKKKQPSKITDEDVKWVRDELSKNCSQDQYDQMIDLLKSIGMNGQNGQNVQKGCIDNIIVFSKKHIDNVNVDTGFRKDNVKSTKQFQKIFDGDLKELKKLNINDNRLDITDINHLAQHFLSDHSPVVSSFSHQPSMLMRFLRKFTSLKNANLK